MNKSERTQLLDNIAFLNHQNNCAMKARRNRDVEEIGLTASQMDVILYLLHHKEKQLYQVDLEKVFHLSNPTVTGLLKRLEAKGFITRVTGCEDKRCKQILTTQKAEEVEKYLSSRKNEANESMFQNFSEKELKIFEELTKKCHENILKEKTSHD